MRRTEMSKSIRYVSNTFLFFDYWENNLHLCYFKPPNTNFYPNQRTNEKIHYHFKIYYGHFWLSKPPNCVVKLNRSTRNKTPPPHCHHYFVKFVIWAFWCRLWKAPTTNLTCHIQFNWTIVENTSPSLPME